MKNQKIRDTILLLIATVLIFVFLAIYNFDNEKNTEEKYGDFPIVGFQELK
ncbi:hypothetical protein CHRYSEOSP005_27850 [Chryseobacterium sp. Alg-005]